MNKADQFKSLGLPADAQRYLWDLYHVLQAWDDFYDGDHMEQKDKRRAIYASLVGLPANPFYIQNSIILLPLISNLILKWAAADSAEREGNFLHLAYAWRADFFGVVLQVLSIVHGSDFAMENGELIMSLYDEKFEDYAREFTCPT